MPVAEGLLLCGFINQLNQIETFAVKKKDGVLHRLSYTYIR